MPVLPPTELVERYGRAGPRYTSYPPATEWTIDFGPEKLALALQQASNSEEAVSIYTHIPFCVEMCRFCGCNVIATRNRERGDAYLDSLELEAALWAEALPNRRRMGQLHLGGGTPTFLTPQQLERLFDILSRHFEPQPGAELALEIDPAITTQEQLDVLGRLGFRRLSMGVQDLDPKVQESINRIQSEEQTLASLNGAREAGFEGVNLDLIYGLPHQTAESFAKTIEKVVAMKPDRLALFGYAHVPWMKPNQRLLPAEFLPQALERLRIFITAAQILEEAGYRQIGLDHFARNDDPLAKAQDEGTLTRNFQGYAIAGAPDTVALGVSAISDLGGAFVQNSHRLSAWEEALEEGRFPVMKGLFRSAEDEVRGAFIRNLMCLMRLELAPLEAEFGPRASALYQESLPNLQPLADDGLIELNPQGFVVTRLGRLFLRNIAMVFDAYLRVPMVGQQVSQKRFSQTL